MGTRHPNPGLVKINRSHTIDEIARLLRVHRNTVRAWIGHGLQTIDEARPTMVHGIALREFLTQRRLEAKTKCPPGYFYCLKCRASRRPAEAMVDYVPRKAGAGNLEGLCPVCERFMYRRASEAQVAAWRAILDIRLKQPTSRIRDRDGPA
jgi:hypothetical protein